MLQGKELRDTCLGSATAGMVSKFLFHPLDTAKARLQGPDGASFKSTPHVIRTTIANEGVRGLYRGIGAVMVGGIPGMCLYLTTYEATKGFLAEERGGAAAGSNFVEHFAAGMLAEVVCCVVFVPVDVIKERLQIQGTHPLVAGPNSAVGGRASGGGGGGAGGVGARVPTPYRGSADAFKTIWKTEGLGGIYKGYPATLASFGPFSALYFVFYEQAKAISLQFLAGRQTRPRGSEESGAGRASDDSARREEGEGDLPVAVTLANAAAASAAASWITNPLDMAKLRMQVQRGAAAGSLSDAGPRPYNGMMDALVQIYRAGGVSSLFKGSGARMAYHAPSVAVAMATFEKANEAWRSLLQ